MRNAYGYLAILLGLALFLVVFAIVFFRERFKMRSKASPSAESGSQRRLLLHPDQPEAGERELPRCPDSLHQPKRLHADGSGRSAATRC